MVEGSSIDRRPWKFGKKNYLTEERTCVYNVHVLGQAVHHYTTKTKVVDIISKYMVKLEVSSKCIIEPAVILLFWYEENHDLKADSLWQILFLL